MTWGSADPGTTGQNSSVNSTVSAVATAGRDGVISCAQSHAHTSVCTIRISTPAGGRAVDVHLTRGGTVYASSHQRVHRGGTLVHLSLRRPPTRGRYTLAITFRDRHGRAHTTTSRITVA